MRQAEVVEKVKEVIKRNSCLIIIGPPGCGKTYSILKACGEMGYRVVEYDADEVIIEELRRAVRTNTITPVVIVIDLLDHTTLSKQESILKSVTGRCNPVVITAHNQYRLTDRYKEFEYVIMYKPDVSELLRLAESKGRELGLKPNYEALNTRDYRQAILSLYGSEGYTADESVFKEVEKYFRTGLIGRSDPQTLITICDNVSSFYGMYAYLLLKYSTVSDLCRRPTPMEALGDLIKGLTTRPRTSYFLEKLRLIQS